MVSRAHSVVAPRLPMTPVSPNPKRRRKLRKLLTKQKITMFIVLLFAGAIVSVLAVRYTTLYVQNASIQQMEQNIEALREQNARLRTEIAKLQSPKRLIDTGMKLGLVFPSAAVDRHMQHQTSAPPKETDVPVRSLE
jgi:cell division protein FtsL